MSVNDHRVPSSEFEHPDHPSAVEFDDTRSVFPILSARTILEEMRTGRYTKLGYAFGIENAAGELFVYPQRKSDEKGIPFDQWSVPSETVAGIFDANHQLIRPESIEETLYRCLSEEQEIDLAAAPSSAEFTVVRNMPLLVLDWQKWDTSRLPERTRGVFSLAVAMQANDEMAEFLENTGQPTNEATTGGSFKDIDFLNDRIRADHTRAGFAFWLKEHIAGIDSGLHEPQVVPIRRRDESLHWQDIRLDETAEHLGYAALEGK